MNKRQAVQKILGPLQPPKNDDGRAWAPSNIALCKYWGKRDDELNLPINSSLSISLGRLGTETKVSQAEHSDVFFLNGERQDAHMPFAVRMRRYLELFRPAPDFYFHVETENNFPTAAGLASSASGFAALALALNGFFGWGAEIRDLSILARLGSGSASRSVLAGFAEWRRGERADGMDSFAASIPETWPELRLAVVSVSDAVKPVGSTEGMKRTLQTSTLYRSWPERAQQDISALRRAIEGKDFQRLGSVAESNALAMHATMIDAQPPLLYWLPETVALFHKIWRLRRAGLPIYFTIDAGPNIKILFEAAHERTVQEHFAGAEIVEPFQKTTANTAR